MIDEFPPEWLLYLRKSVGYAGLARQRAATTAMIERRGGRVIDDGEFSDADKTAFRNTHRDLDAPLPPRPDFDRMLAEMDRRPGVGVAAWHADRWGRDPESAEILIRACRRGSHLLATKAGGDYDVTTANGRSHLRGDINAANDEVDHNVERMLEAKAEAAALGLWLGGKRPFGWQAAGEGVLVKDEAEAAFIAQAGADLLDGVPEREIVRKWIASGLTGALGGRPTASTLRRMLLRPRNAGLAEHRGQLLDLGLDENGEPRKAQWPAILDEDTWRAVCAVLADPGRRTHSATSASHLLTGIALCGGCGVAVMATKSSRGLGRYACARHARQLAPHPGPHASRSLADVDALVAYFAVGRMKRKDAALLLRSDRREERAALIVKREAAEGKARTDFGLYQAGVITDLELAAARKRTREDLAAAEAGLAELDRADALAPFLDDPEGKWNGAALGQQRGLVAALMHVTIMPGAHRGRRAGFRVGERHFDPELVDVRWTRRLPSDG